MKRRTRPCEIGRGLHAPPLLKIGLLCSTEICYVVAMRKWIVLVGFVGCLGLLAALHHVVVITAAGTGFARAFDPTCSWCHGPAYTSDPDAPKS